MGGDQVRRPEGDEQTKKMNALGEDADAVATQFPDRLEIQIWDGIITSERASMASMFSALGLAKRARDILEQAYKMAPAKLDAGAPTSLGVLYYRVPGFPIGFGDKERARQLLEQAIKLAPTDWMLGISTVTSSMSRRNTPNPLKHFATHSACRRILIGQPGIKTVGS